ncbi:hypothetical protein SELMODRAFT_422124 [Selaginella moellendorffii]|uniref:Uncharacterized protein n=1 Tax=Selaginella moellendorffii TaxID=88036 RepID=D8SHF0_SELML|nr:uncharacterized protein LOC9662093 [Selaginella moellendorffii]EFJ15993.1 hypothetical protein SELMODRAFT_422124 [Selaginella moellendorffii]|eukprot:XP_002982748.1 uncharacterized protein LOC9662093 [Selaginella moellendorffii]
MASISAATRGLRNPSGTHWHFTQRPTGILAPRTSILARSNILGTQLRWRVVLPHHHHNHAIRAAIGENPTNNPDDFVVLGLGHCFIEDSNGKLQDHFVLEPIGAGALECMENGGKTCYKHVASMHLSTALAQDHSQLPEELRSGAFCEDFAFRTKCAARSWMRDYPQEKIVRYIPLGTVRSDFNYNLEDKRVLNKVNIVTDADNIKQDMSIDVYGRKKDDDANTATDAAPPSKKELEEDLISSLYNA